MVVIRRTRFYLLDYESVDNFFEFERKIKLHSSICFLDRPLMKYIKNESIQDESIQINIVNAKNALFSVHVLILFTDYRCIQV